MIYYSSTGYYVTIRNYCQFLSDNMNTYISPNLSCVFKSYVLGCFSCLFIWYHMWGPCMVPGPPPGRWGPRSHTGTPSSSSVNTPPSWSSVSGIYFLFSLKTLLWVLGWFFKKMPKPQAAEKAGKQRMRRTYKERKQLRRQEKAQGWRRGRGGRRKAAARPPPHGRSGGCHEAATRSRVLAEAAAAWTPSLLFYATKANPFRPKPGIQWNVLTGLLY